MRSASLVRLVIVDVWLQCQYCHVICFAETGFPRVQTMLPNLIVSPNTGKREAVTETSQSTPAGRVLHFAGSVKAPYIQRCGIRDPLSHALGSQNTSCKVTYCTFSHLTSALTYVLPPTRARGIFAHFVWSNKYFEVFSFLGRDAAYVGSSLPTFRDGLSIPSAWPLRMAPIGCTQSISTELTT